jgi:hypothetical protein
MIYVYFYVNPAKEEIMKKRRLIGCCLVITLVLMVIPRQLWAKDVTILPAIALRTVYDDNLDFDRKDEKDSFGANAVPRVTLDYKSELLEYSLHGEVDFIKYFTETDFDRTNQLYGLDGRYQMSPKWNFTGKAQYRRDESIDSLLEETGQAFKRERVETYDGGAGLYYQFAELSDLGLTADYRKRDFNSRTSNDFQRYRFDLPYTKRFANERDTLSLIPGFTIFDSDNSEDAKDYRFKTEWERRISETLTSEVHAGARYTVIDQNRGGNDSNWGYIGKLGLKKVTETFSGGIAATSDISANSDGEIVNVNRILIEVDKRLLERFGFKFFGSGYYTDTESTNAKDEKTTYFDLRPSVYYLLTENHLLELKYEYQNRRELDRPGNPVTQRNRVWLGIVLKFPKKLN